jgi:hypothetical protein
MAREREQHPEHFSAILICCEGKTEKCYFDIIALYTGQDECVPDRGQEFT